MGRNAQKKEKTRRETTAIKVWVTPAEKAAITVKADAYSLSASTYLCDLALGSNDLGRLCGHVWPQILYVINPIITWRTNGKDNPYAICENGLQ